MRVCKGRYLKAFAGGLILLSGMLLSGCRNREGRLSEREMVDLIVDLKLAEAYANSQMGGHDITLERERLAKSVLAEHDVTQEQLDSTLSWYGRNLDKYSELYQKVDKKMLQKRKALMKEGYSGQGSTEGDNLWPFGKNGLITSLGSADGWILSLNDPGLSKGDRLEWIMHTNNTTTPLVGVLGVEYEDGTSEAVTTYFTNRNHIELSFQTDTGRLVNRIYGTMRLKQSDNTPIFVDSIALRRLSYDSLEYVKYRSQKKYGYPVRITKEDRERKHRLDSLRRDSISKAAKLRQDSIRNLNASRDSIAAASSGVKPSDKAKEIKPIKDTGPLPRRPGNVTERPTTRR